MQPWQQQALRGIPAVTLILDSEPAQALLQEHQRELVTAAVDAALGEVRKAVLAAGSTAELNGLDLHPAALARRAARVLAQRLRPRLRRVINATGVVLHTNLGRAPLARAAVEQILATAGRYTNLELDLATGERGSRYAHVEELVCSLTGAEAALVVNNNAGAVLLMLSALCRGKQVIVSRGELVEIGGAFRVPDVMVQGGAELVEAGTTNKTHRADYERAIRPETGAILKVHTSNFRIVGFTETPTVQELAELARRRGLPLLVDWGSGVMLDLARLGLEHEATMPELLAAGADLVTFSGDKLLGGPQAGFIVGRRELIRTCRSHPLTRALRIDKLTLAGIEATLRLYLEPERARSEIPALQMLARTPGELRPTARRLARLIRTAVGTRASLSVTIQDAPAEAGGGSLPGLVIPSVAVAVSAPDVPPHVLEGRLRDQDPPVLARIHKNQVLLDVRTLWPDDLSPVAAAVAAALGADAAAATPDRVPVPKGGIRP